MYLAGGGLAVASRFGVGPIEGSLASVAVGAGFLAVGVSRLVGLLVRLRSGNARRAAALPFEPGVSHKLLAVVANRVLGIQSIVGRVTDVTVGSLRLGAAILITVWGSLVAGLTVLGVVAPGPVGAAPTAALLVALLYLFYAGTDWQAIDSPAGPPPMGIGARLFSAPG